MENKYYTPELSELCVGFEYQRYMERDFDEGSCIWEDKIFPEEGLCTGTIEYPNIVEIFYENYLEGVRVKYLDQQDIEDCGFGLKRRLLNIKKIHYRGILFGNENYNIMLYLDDSIKITTSYGDTLFQGIIKNKTEFKKILKQIGVYERV